MSKKVFITAELNKQFPSVRVNEHKNGKLTNHFKDLSKFQTEILNQISDEYSVDYVLKRSGTGITVVWDL